MNTSRYYPVGVFVLLLAAYHLMFGAFFTPEGGGGNGIGGDYSLALPSYLDGYYWFLNNGLSSPPWFTPAFCGGQLFFADPQSVYYSPNQFLTFLTDPLTANYLALLALAAAGFWGMFFFCRHCLATESAPALLAASLWLFNGFSTHHHLIGHVGFLPVLLAPVLAYLLVPISASESAFTLAGRIGASSLLLAACLHAGLGSLMIPFGLSVWGLACLAILRGQPARYFYSLSALTAVLAIGIALAKLVAASSVMANFPRSQYRLPGISDPMALVTAVFQMLFHPEEQVHAYIEPIFINRDVGLGPHELAFDLTLIPAVLIGLLVILAVPKIIRSKLRMGAPQSIHSVLIAVIVLLPFALNYYSPAWNVWLKSLPIIGSTTGPWRWFIIPLPLLCAASAMSVHLLISDSRPLRNILALAAIVMLVAIKAVTPREFYLAQPYDPRPILEAYERARQPDFKPAIRFIGTYRDQNGQPVGTYHQNDLIAMGASQAFCYNPLFGYKLENFDVGALRPGNPLKAREGILNLKNPSCYVFPQENDCEPGEHFLDTPEDRIRAENLVNYRPWQFNKSQRQNISETITAISIIVAVLLMLAPCLGLILMKRRCR